jgi:hypothetical protein
MAAGRSSRLAHPVIKSREIAGSSLDLLPRVRQYGATGRTAHQLACVTIRDRYKGGFVQT